MLKSFSIRKCRQVDVSAFGPADGIGGVVSEAPRYAFKLLLFELNPTNYSFQKFAILP